MTSTLIKRIALPVAMLVVVGGAVVASTGAFFSDTETSTGNTFTAGAIDLTIDNTAYYNGNLVSESTWDAQDLEEGVHFFFNFDDFKPGDWEEDTISLHVTSNPAYACVDVTLTKDDEVSRTEPEADLNDPEDVVNDLFDGELAQELEFMWWADDGDNVLEDDETVISSGNLGQAPEGSVVTVPLADSNENIWTGSGPIAAGQPYYIGKAFCMGDLDIAESTYDDEATQGGDDNSGPDTRPVDCDGRLVGNISQTDSVMMDISFYAVQSRNNDNFQCGDHL